MRCAWLWGLGLLVLLAGCGNPIEPNGIRMGLAGPPQNLDPRFATDATCSRVNRLLYRGQVDFDPEGRPVPALARWERLDPDRYRFTLGEAGRTFSDGGRLTAQDVVATFASILDPATRSPHRPLLALITRMAALGTEQVEFELSRPDPLFPAYLTLGILPAARIAAGHPFERAPVGSGSFRFLAWPEQGRLVLERVADGERLELQVVAEPSVRVSSASASSAGAARSTCWGSTRRARRSATRPSGRRRLRPTVQLTGHRKAGRLLPLVVARALRRAFGERRPTRG